MPKKSAIRKVANVLKVPVTLADKTALKLVRKVPIAGKPVARGMRKILMIPTDVLRAVNGQTSKSKSKSKASRRR